jgi:hypothetical protein
VVLGHELGIRRVVTRRAAFDQSSLAAADL